MVTDDQRTAALLLANDIRSKRARLKQSIAFGEADARELLRGEIPDYANTMKLSKLLCAVPKVGKVKADKIIRQTARRDIPLCRVSPTTREMIAQMLP